MNNKIIVGITQGDSNGIGYEVIIKSLSDLRIFDLCTPVIYGSSKMFGFYKKHLKEAEAISTNLLSDDWRPHPKRVNIVNCVPEDFLAEPGRETPEGSKAAIMSLERAVSDLKEGKIDVLVTAPFNKASVSQEGFDFPGHTEYLANAFECKQSLMFMISEDLKVAVATNHEPISKVSSLITKELIRDKISILSQSLKRDFAIDRPKIAVLSLNPHSGDKGLLGGEEIEVLTPIISEMFHEGELVFGPFPADGFFASQYKGNFDAVLAMYHDQGLVPFKAMSYDRGVNFTAGLPIVRCSPDHGTAYDVAGKGVACHLSMLSSIYAACDIYKNRLMYDHLISNKMSFEHDYDYNPKDSVIE